MSLILDSFVCCRSSVGPSNWVERASRLVVSDESDDDGILPMDMAAILRDLYR